MRFSQPFTYFLYFLLYRIIELSFLLYLVINICQCHIKIFVAKVLSKIIVNMYEEDILKEDVFATSIDTCIFFLCGHVYIFSLMCIYYIFFGELYVFVCW